MSSTATRPYQICNHCIMDSSDPNIVFDDRGRCDYCNNFERLIQPNWHTDARGQAALQQMAETIRADVKGKDFDCVIGLSGGLDSSFAAYVAKEKMGLRPLLFHVDAGWNTDQAVATTTVVGVSPSLPTLPANVLKFYVTFSAPMRQGREVLQQVRLLDEAGKELVAPWRDMELWNIDATRLSLFVHPGRIKQGVNLRDEFGPVLEPGKRYTLVVGTDLVDAAGLPLARTFRYAFTTAPELRQRVDVAAWSIAAPKSGSREPLVVTFDRSLDRHLAWRALALRDDTGR